MIKVIPVTDARQLEIAHQIRTTVFVDEQKVPAQAEIDEYEASCRHYLAFNKNDEPVGTARWRTTPGGVKLERFAVLKDARGAGAGSALLQKVIEDIKQEFPDNTVLLYLHSQVSAMSLYKKFNFTSIGEMFEECGIQHYKMIRQL